MAKDTFLNRKPILKCGDQSIDLSTPVVMAILNITPDSFYAGSRLAGIDEALRSAEKHLKGGACIMDIGAYSSRPGADEVTETEEIDRLIPLIKALKKEFPAVVLSVDTFRSAVAKQAADAGVGLINDISGGQLDHEMFPLVAKLKLPYVMMHMKGRPENMQDNPVYDNIGSEVYQYFDQRVKTLQSLGQTQIIIDPGFGFAKTTAHNFQLLNELEILNKLDCPIMVGFSRKSMIYKTLNITPAEALNGTTVLNTIALMKGANILRVHDAQEANDCIKLCLPLL
jgi:dihydropteroate synthase